jgi:hypothetical protein
MGPSGLSALSFFLNFFLDLFFLDRFPRTSRVVVPGPYATFSNTTAFQMKSRS